MPGQMPQHLRQNGVRRSVGQECIVVGFRTDSDTEDDNNTHSNNDGGPRNNASQLQQHMVLDYVPPPPPYPPPPDSPQPPPPPPPPAAVIDNLDTGLQRLKNAANQLRVLETELFEERKKANMYLQELTDTMNALKDTERELRDERTKMESLSKQSMVTRSKDKAKDQVMGKLKEVEMELGKVHKKYNEACQQVMLANRKLKDLEGRNKDLERRNQNLDDDEKEQLKAKLKLEKELAEERDNLRESEWQHAVTKDKFMAYRDKAGPRIQGLEKQLSEQSKKADGDRQQLSNLKGKLQKAVSDLTKHKEHAQALEGASKKDKDLIQRQAKSLAIEKECVENLQQLVRSLFKGLIELLSAHKEDDPETYANMVAQAKHFDEL